MAVTRRFLDWTRPALVSAAEWLREKYRRKDEASTRTLDLRGAIVLVPGGRARRRLLELLVERAEADGLVLLPPVITTEMGKPGEAGLPELLYTPKRPFASELTQLLAWAAALRKSPQAVLDKVIPHPPANGDFTRWLELAELVRDLHTKLAADALHFGHVAQRKDEISGYHEQSRWEALRKIQDEYLRTLDGLNQWDIQTARIVGIEQWEFKTERDVVLLGTVDLNRAMRLILDQVADRVTALIHAPLEWEDRFDQHGCLIPAVWKVARLPINDGQIERVDGPADQADAVTRWMASLGGKYRSDEIVVGVPDESLVPQLERQLAQCDVPTRWVEGKRVAESAPYKLLEAATRFAHRRRFADLAALVRHPDVEDWLEPQLTAALTKQSSRDTKRERRAEDIQTALDLFYKEQFAARLDPKRIEEIKGDWPAIHALVIAIDLWLRPIAQERQRLFAWADGLRLVLKNIYGHRILNTEDVEERYLLKACEAIEESLEALSLVPPELEPEITLGEAVRLVLRPLASTSIPPLPDPGAVELLGWLELALDDAPALAVTSVNEGFVPKSTSGDPFLPNELRMQLGLLSNERRYARDAYALSVLLATRADLRLIVGHRDAENNPLIPSRLLFATDEPSACARALRMFEKLEEAPPRRNLLSTDLKQRDTSNFQVPLPAKDFNPPAFLSVSQFKAYLACHYRYYLGHVLSLVSLSDQAAELDPAAFGSLIHDVLQHFGRTDKGERSSTRPDKIFAILEDLLEKLAAARYGKDAGRAALRFQVEQARIRLRAFAEWQARQTDEGWQIVHSEDSETQLECNFPTDDGPMKIRGRIDRIDRHQHSGIFRVLDYKTADTAKEPQQTHLQSDQWIDLQLPLYRYLVKTVEWQKGASIDGQVQLGYINLPRDQASMGCAIADWSREQLEDADKTARDVIHGITHGIFLPKTEPPPAFSEVYAAICQDNRIGKRRPLQDEEATS
ncbi:MAG: PD-(D/E)XK nuclease family protein [Pirellulaceae bacterium]